MRVRLQAVVTPERGDQLARPPQHRKRDHDPERVVDGRDPEDGCRKGRRQVGALVHDRVRAPLGRPGKQVGQLRGRVARGEDPREEEEAELLRRHAVEIVEGDCRAGFRMPDAGGKDVEALLLQPGRPIGRGGERDLMAASVQSTSNREQRGARARLPAWS